MKYWLHLLAGTVAFLNGSSFFDFKHDEKLDNSLHHLSKKITGKSNKKAHPINQMSF